MGVLHKQVEKLNAQVGELLAVIRKMPAGHTHKFVGRPDCNSADDQSVPVCMPDCPACTKELILAKYGV